jgi:hypothetical protein
MRIDMHQWWLHWPTIIVGGVLGLLLVPVGEWMLHAARETYDDSHPVIEAAGHIVERDADSVTVEIVGTKLRDCTYVANTGYTLGADGILRSTYIARTDQPPTGATRPVGAQHFGRWRLWPTNGAISASIWVTHQCEGRLVRTQLADVRLSTP